MKKFTARQRLRYKFDNLMALGTAMHFAGLFIVATLMILAIAALARLTQDGQQLPITRLVWMGLMRTLDPGTIGGDEGSWPFLFLMILATVGGIFVVGTLNGLEIPNFQHVLVLSDADLLETQQADALTLITLLHLREISRQTGERFSITESARRQGQIAIGYRLHALGHDPKLSYGVMVNPDKSEQVTFSERDRIIVLAEN